MTLPVCTRVLFLSTIFIYMLATSPLNAFSQESNGFANRSKAPGTDHRFQLTNIERNGKARSVAFSPDGRYFAVTFADGTARVWKIPNSDKLQLEEIAYLKALGKEMVRKMIRVIIFSPDGNSIVTGCDDCTIRFSQLRPLCKEIRQINHDQSPIALLDYCQDGHTLVSIGAEGTIRCWHPGSGKKICSIPCRKFIDVVVGSARKTEVAAAVSNAVFLFDTSDGRELAEIGSSPDSIQSLAYSHDGRMLALSNQSAMEIYEVASKRLISRLTIPRCDTLCFANTSRFLVAGSTEGSLFKCDLATGRTQSIILEDCRKIIALRYSPLGDLFVFGRSDSTYFVWKIPGDSFSEDVCIEPEESRQKLASILRGSAEYNRLPPGIWLWNNLYLFAPKYPNLPRNLSRDDCQVLWDHLREWNGRKGYWSIWCLVTCEKQAITFLRDKLHPVKPVDSRQLLRLVTDLDNDDFQVRQQAFLKLKEISDLAVPLLRRRLNDKPSLNTRRLVQELLKEASSCSSDQLRLLRAIQILEYIGTSDAMLILKRLSEGATDSRITVDARLTIQYLKKIKIKE